MALSHWWLLPLAVLAMAGTLLFLWRHRTPGVPFTPVAHADRLTALAGYRAAVARRRRWLAVALAGAGVLGLSLAVAAARPVTETLSAPESVNRDIMLCLDVSGSMLETDEAIVGVFSELVGSFRGERIGLVIFDSSAVTVFPLTDDYDFVAEQLTVAKKSLGGAGGGYEFFAGTYESAGSSLIGDGLASCANGFPAVDQTQRSRSIVFATDNMLAGRSLFSLAESAALAQRSGIRVYSLNPNDFGSSTLFGDAAEGLKQASSTTGGQYYSLQSQTAVKSIVDAVQATEASRLQGAPRRTVQDQPAWPLGAALVSLLVLGTAGWRLHR
ncbi:VWA domain-containing protein [Specibacter sp. NPDC057265]|uniref:vWA domain-containing protein n=1 Tax=Specibacter sp. NPDC057265 TaxID=3346075 RepID=UPI00363E179B